MGTSEVMGWETPLIRWGGDQNFSLRIVFHCNSGAFQPLRTLTGAMILKKSARWQWRGTKISSKLPFLSTPELNIKYWLLLNCLMITLRDTHKYHMQSPSKLQSENSKRETISLKPTNCFSSAFSTLFTSL